MRRVAAPCQSSARKNRRWQRAVFLHAWAATVGALLGGVVGCGEPALPRPVRRTVTLVQTVPVESSGFELPGVAHTHEVWLDMVANARRTVDVASFYVCNRRPGRLEPVLLEIESAARRGVAVRLLVDASFAEKYPSALERLAANISVRRFDLKSLNGGVQHAKYVVVDGSTLYIGSANFDWRALEHIHELGVRIDAPEMAHALTSVFEQDWNMAGGTVFSDSAGGVNVRSPRQPYRWPTLVASGQRITLLASPRGLLPVPAAWDLPKLLQVLDRATDTIDIQLLSYDAAYRDGRPWMELQAVLLRAGARGVRVRLALSHWQKGHMGAIFELQRAPGIDVALVQVPRHSSGPIPFARVVHAKYLVVDGAVSWIGTSNWKADYFYNSRNVGVLVRGTAIAEQLHRLFEGVFDGPYATIVDPTIRYDPPTIGGL